MKQDDEYVAVFDLNIAYEIVDLKKLLALCEKLLPADLTKMIRLTQDHFRISTVDDARQYSAEMRKGVTQGSLLSQDLFKIYTGPLASSFCSATRRAIKHLPGHLIAEDCLLQLHFAEATRKALRT